MAAYLCDVNVWFALAVGTHRHHEAVSGWAEEIERLDRLHFCRATQQSFLRLLTTPAAMALYGEAPRTNDKAWQL